MDQKTRILIAEDSAADAELIARELGKGDFAHTSKWVKSRGEFLQTLEAFVPDIILCDYNMPGFGAPEALEIIKERLPATPLIVISGTIGEAVAVEMLKAGATDYVMKNNLPKLTPAIKRALKEAQANTERKELEKELARAKEIQFRTLIENLPGKVFLKDRNSVYISCNEYYAKDLGIKSEEVAGKTDYGFFPTHLAEKYRADDKHVMESGETKNVEEEYATIRDYLGNFQTGFVNMVKSPIRDDAGNVTGVLGFFWDITERKKSEEAIRLLNQQMEYVLEATHTGLDIIDSQFNLKYVDSGWQKVYGDFTGRKCYEYFMDRKEKCPGCGIEKALETKKAVVTEEILAKEGNRCVQVTTIPFQDKAGEWLVAEVNVDITERKKVETESRRVELLKTSSEIKSKFTAMVSHELRSPLSVIKEALGVVLDGMAGNVNDEQKKFLDMAKTNAERLGRLINNVLDFQKIESEKMEYDIRDNDIHEAIEEASESLRVLSVQKGLDFRVEPGDLLPKVKFDRDKIIQVVTNLGSNAIKFTPKGSVTISVQQENNEIHVQVRDTGPGIKAEDIPRLFQPFEQINPGKGGVNKRT